jgi:uncharacterized membrane protein
MIVISKKLFVFIVVGLASLAVASVCSLLRLPMSQAVVLFMITWIGLVATLETTNFLESKSLRDSHRQE